MANYNIGGNLPFSGGGKDYASAYNAALQMNSTNYNNILAGFQQTASQNQRVQQGIQQGYDRLQGDVLGGIQGMDMAQRQAIADQYQADRGRTSQQLINRGLGNSTVQQSVDRGLIYDREKAHVALTGQTQGINAQYRSQLGLAGLEYQKYAAAQNTSQANQQLQWMNSVNAAYPNASAYAQMAMAKGQSGGGGGVGPGGVSYGGSVKSPLGSGSGSGSPYIQGWEYGSGGVKPQNGQSPYAASPYGGGDWWDSGTIGSSRWDQVSGGAFGESPLFNEDVGGLGVPSMGGNAGGGGYNWPEEDSGGEISGILDW